MASILPAFLFLGYLALAERRLEKLSILAIFSGTKLVLFIMVDA